MTFFSTRGLMLTLVVGLAAFAAPAGAATFTVTTANDTAAAGTLRWAINQTELQPGPDTIEFDIAGAGPHTIALAGDLPALTGPVRVDGYTEPGAHEATRNRPAELMIDIDATNAFRGLDIGDGTEVRGLAIHSAQSVGIFVEGRENVVSGNHIGTDITGSFMLSNGEGVEVNGGDNLIGGPRNADRNVIGGAECNVRVIVGTGTEIQGNRIGTNARGNGDLGGDLCGVKIESSSNIVTDNLISAHDVGLRLWGDDNVVQGNLIGTNVTGSARISNGTGIEIEGGDDNLIGGSAPGEGNVISGSGYFGLHIEPGRAVPGSIEGNEIGPAEGNEVRGNLIGTDAQGTAPIANGDPTGLAAVSIEDTNANTIGGEEPGAGNVIAGNTGDGVQILGADADVNRVAGNWIGTNAAGATLGNGQSGVEIDAGDRNTVGPANVIAHNRDDGVTVDETAVKNAILANQIFANGTSDDDLGIDLGADGVTVNDPLDADAGANELQNNPQITAATDVAGATKIEWTLDSLPSTTFHLEFFASTTCDDSGNGEGQTYLGSTDIVTDTAGHAADATIPATSAAPGAQITMTATHAGRDTSEFSPCQAVA
jgi:hypothetical protein